MSMSRRELETRVVDICQRISSAGWVANHDGNVSVRLDADRILCTPTAFSKAQITRDDLIVVDNEGKVVSGRNKPFSELQLHLVAYRSRRDVQAVLHAHPPTATGMAVAGVPVQSTLMAEPVVSLGAEIPLVPFAMPKSPELSTALSSALDDADAVTLQNHGALSVGPDLDTAFFRMELVEHVAKIQLVAQQMGGGRNLSASDTQVLLQARTKAGLGKRAREEQAAAAKLVVRRRLVGADLGGDATWSFAPPPSGSRRRTR